MTVVRFDWQLAWRVIVLSLLLAWPLMVFGRPSYASDSLSYYKGGRAAVAFTLSKLARFHAVGVEATNASDTGHAAPDKLTEEARGARSISYSIISYLLSAPDGTMTVLVIGQSIATALSIAVLAIALDATGAWAFILQGVIIAAATPAACFANLAMPDILAGVMICILAALALCLPQLSGGVRLTLVLLGAFAVSSHASLPPLAAGMSVLGGILLARTDDLIGGRLRAMAWLFAPLLLGSAVTVVAGFIGFGEISMAPKRYPLTLARSVEDGPARWYLERNCGERRYAVCEVFGSDIPSTVETFLWDESGLRRRASPEQMDRIRAEEPEIVLRAAAAYPAAQAASIFRNVSKQLLHFGLNQTRFDQRLVRDSTGTPRFEPLAEAYPWMLDVVATLSLFSALLCLCWMLWRFGALRGKERSLLFLVTAGILGNAIVCAVFSAAADRYQARVIWVLPVVAIAMMLSRRDARVVRFHHSLPVSARIERMSESKDH